ncbi:putative disease resistance RPP8-like protein 2 [Sesamum alatum]|uniref:Disease resistance RPP8-like protein 2 n=1 Tax=Sesamum alatum TaxID=300844 RepID=A0AAE2CXT1_9LAMI|nr:putative disease resistance RPP8-like protein 2 [Sesamum alatum]
MADAKITFLLENRSQLMKHYADVISEAENELKQLKNDVALLESYHRQAIMKAEKGEVVREMERQMREAIDDAEDTIDSCLTEAGVANARNKLLRSLKTTNRGNGGLAREVESLRQNKFPLLRMDNVVGLEDEEETIIKYLREETNALDVISIIGMQGLGKTTLAWKIYQNHIIQYEFPIRIWVYVSQEFNIKDVFLSILKAFTQQDMSMMSDQDLALTVHECLKTGKFLLVMDDVWNVEAWNAIQQALPRSNKMGKVLLTSSNRIVGSHANVSRQPHMLRFLTEEESWKLLQLEVFGKMNGCDDPVLEVIGENIAKQCDGLPLAIRVIGGILLDKCSTNQANRHAWKEVSENVNKYLQNDEGYGVQDITAMSYNMLPEYLRDCFLYLGVFPEDYEIPAWTLIRLWIAEGFIQDKEGQSLEETAEENLNDLINRNLVMVDKSNPTGKVKTCRVHDLIRQFCISKADEQNLFKEIKRSNEGVFHPPVSDIHKYRRLCIHFHLLAFLSAKPKGRGIRSFLCFYKEAFVLHPQYVSAIPDAFTLLRVWHSKSIKFNQFPARVTKLIHLKYLTLSWDDLDILPASISELWSLQTLVIDTKSRTLKIKANIWKMIQLRHLKTKAAIELLDIEGKGKANENLQTLSRLSPKYCIEEVFDRASNLKRLGIRGPLNSLLEAKHSLEKLALLENLKLVNDLDYGSVFENPLRGLPPPSSFPPNLKTLTLSATVLDWKHMSTLGTINSLEVLKLKDNAFSGNFWNAVGGGFLRLRFLLIATTDLVFWEVSSDDAFPSLQHLVLKDCRRLGKIPATLAKSLQILEIDRVGKSAVEAAREIEREKTQLMQGHKLKLFIGPGCE